MPVHPCMRTAVDYIALAAYPYIKHIPRVKITGAVKTTIQNKWKYIYERAWANKNHDYQVVGFDYDEEVAKLSTRMVYETPVCTCPASCLPEQSPGHFVHDFDWDDTYVPFPSIPKEEFLAKNADEQPK